LTNKELLNQFIVDKQRIVKSVYTCCNVQQQLAVDLIQRKSKSALIEL